MNKEYLQNSFRRIGMELSEGQLSAFERYAALLIEWNEKMNLTAITAPEEIVTKHFVDSAVLLWQLPELTLSGKSLIDVGTGAGFPGLPLKILCPELKLTLLDSLAKRLHFLEEVVRELGLEEVQLVHARAEDGGRDRLYRERYDLAVSRAVANLSVLSEYCLPYVRQGGSFIAYKSAEIAEETGAAARAIRLLGGAPAQLRSFTLPDTDLSRSLVVIRKTGETPAIYPRKAGAVKQRPL